jgi:phosphotriesterase-related protein
MTHVETLNGPVDPETLGVTLMHEHVFVLSSELQIPYPGFGGWDPDLLVPEARRRLIELKNGGVDTIVDVTTVETGRDIRHVLAAAEDTGLNIIVATGMQCEDRLVPALTNLGPGRRFGGPEILDDLFLRDITVGVQDTGVKAGILKCATDEPGVTPDVERVLRGCARVHVQTGVPITTHTNAAQRTGLDQIRIFDEEGVDLERVVIGHSGDSTDLDYLERLLEKGVVLGMDRFGVPELFGYPSLEQRCETVAELCRRGYADRMVLAHDGSCIIDWLPVAYREALADANPHGYLYVSRVVLPELANRGVTEQQIEQMLVLTPRRILGHRPSA